MEPSSRFTTANTEQVATSPRCSKQSRGDPPLCMGASHETWSRFTTACNGQLTTLFSLASAGRSENGRTARCQPYLLHVASKHNRELRYSEMQRYSTIKRLCHRTPFRCCILVFNTVRLYRKPRRHQKVPPTPTPAVTHLITRGPCSYVSGMYLIRGTRCSFQARSVYIHIIRSSDSRSARISRGLNYWLSSVLPHPPPPPREARWHREEVEHFSKQAHDTELPVAVAVWCSEEARDIAEALDGQGFSGLVADHVLRRHVFPLFVITALFIALYVVYKVVGDPVLRLLKVGERCRNGFSKG